MSIGSTPLVSVVVATYNQSALIGETVNSVLAQTHPRVEIIVVDDGSADGTAAAVPTAPHVQVLVQHNQGVAAARNNGFARASGDYVLFLDGDDVLLPTKIARDVALLEARSDLDLAYCAWAFFSTDRPNGLGECHPRREGLLLNDLLLKRVSPVPAVVTIRRSALGDTPPFDPTCAEAGDYDLWVRLSLSGHRFGYVDDALVRYRVVTGSMTSHLAKTEAATSRVLDKAFASSMLPGGARALEGRARAILKYEIASECFRLGDHVAGHERLREAIALDPQLARDESWVVEWLAAVALGPRVPQRAAIIDEILEHVPPEASDWRKLRRRLHGHYHLVAAFLADQQRDAREARTHAWPAVHLRPRVLLNRGFLKLLWRSTVG